MPKVKSIFETYLTGRPFLNAKLKRLDIKTRKKYTRSALSQGGTVIVKAIKRAAPVGKTRNLKKAIGKSLKKAQQDPSGEHFQGLRAGMNVAKKLPNQAPHGHLNVLGTKRRKTKSGKSTGKMPKNDFIRRAVRSSLPKAKRKIAQVLKRKIKSGAN